MATNDWRNMQWKKMDFSQKAWLVIICFVAAALLVAAGLHGSGTVKIPDWVALLLVLFGFYAAYKNVSGNHMFSDEESEDESDSEDDDE